MSKHRSLFLVGIAAILLGGCVDSGSRPSQRGGQATREARSGDALLEDVIGTLNRLEQYVNLDLRPPKVILDATTSRDNKTVLATLTPNPANPGERADYLNVTTKNSRFNNLDVVPGDRVRYFILTDEYGKQSHVELVVRRVLHENALLVVGGLPQEVTTPERVEIWRYADDREKEIHHRLIAYARTGRPPIGWEPSPDEAVLKQVVDRLNGWLRSSSHQVAWTPDPLIGTLPERLVKLVNPKQLAGLTFEEYDGRLLQEAIWLRDVSNWARGDAPDDLDRATHLFDWTVRNIQLETRESLGGIMHRPWQTMLDGRGTAEERAWGFILLARQQGLDVVMLALADAEESDGLRPWLPALWSGGKLYLFDSRLGLPIPGPNGQGVATLEEAAADDQLLRQLDLDAEHPYPVKASELDKVVAIVEASPLALSQRALLLEGQLAGEAKVVLTAAPSALAKSLAQSPRISEVRLWDLPYRTIDEQLGRDRDKRLAAARQFQVYPWRPPLWKARVMHFAGKWDGDNEAKYYYRAVRPADARIDGPGLTEVEVLVMRTAKIDASYFLGLLAFDDGDHRVAIDYFANRTLEATPDGPWTAGARYNLARAYEATGEMDRAIELYRSETSAQSHGNQLRARWLEAKPGGTEP